MIDRILRIVDKEPREGVKIISAKELETFNIDINSNIILLDIDKENASQVVDVLLNIYGDDYRLKLIKDIELENENVSEIMVEELTNHPLNIKNIVFLPKIDKKNKRIYDFFDIMGIMKILRGDNGCSWDKEQNHKSIRQSLIEEAYEVVDAIDNDDKEEIKEELGDLLLQVVFHSQIAYENKEFTITDVTSALANKLIYRHPHIFSQKSVENTEEVVYNWNKLKYKNRQITTLAGKLNDLPKLPALMHSYKVQEKAADVGFDWEDVGGAIDKVHEEIEEVMEVIHIDAEKTEEEIGDVLFAIVNLSRFLNINPEIALNLTIKKFITRLEKMEQKASQLGKNLEDMNLDELDKLWNQVKTEE